MIELPVEIRIGDFQIQKTLLLWINDGLMAVFFLLVGLELKREFLQGELADAGRIALPAFGAVGGMLVPALIYAAFNWGDPVALGIIVGSLLSGVAAYLVLRRALAPDGVAS